MGIADRALQFPGQRHAVLDRQFDVEQYQVHDFPLEDLAHCVAVAGAGYAPVELAEVFADYTANGGFVVDDENVLCHAHESR